MSRAKFLLYIATPLVLLSGCSLRAPVYNPELGGFPMYKNTQQVSHEVESRQRKDGHREIAKSQTALIPQKSGTYESLA
jgi:hypothetical protein